LNVGQNRGRDAVRGHRGGERQADRAGGGPHDDDGDDAEPGVVIDPGDDPAFAASARNRLAVTSICHSSIAAERSQRR
jgi:hypothetical protein